MRSLSAARKAMMRRRRVAKATDAMKGIPVLSISGNRYGRAMVTLGFKGNNRYSPAHAIAREIRNALDPTRISGKVRSLKDMSPEEISALENTYGVPVRPR